MTINIHFHYKCFGIFDLAFAASKWLSPPISISCKYPSVRRFPVSLDSQQDWQHPLLSEIPSLISQQFTIWSHLQYSYYIGLFIAFGPGNGVEVSTCKCIVHRLSHVLEPLRLLLMFFFQLVVRLPSRCRLRSLSILWIYHYVIKSRSWFLAFLVKVSHAAWSFGWSQSITSVPSM